MGLRHRFPGRGPSGDRGKYSRSGTRMQGPCKCHGRRFSTRHCTWRGLPRQWWSRCRAAFPCQTRRPDQWTAGKRSPYRRAQRREALRSTSYRPGFQDARSVRSYKGAGSSFPRRSFARQSRELFFWILPCSYGSPFMHRSFNDRPRGFPDTRARRDLPVRMCAVCAAARGLFAAPVCPAVSRRNGRFSMILL